MMNLNLWTGNEDLAAGLDTQRQALVDWLGEHGAAAS
jgi:hypothetical protein